MSFSKSAAGKQRSAQRCERNSEAAVRDVTALSLRTDDEEVRITGFTILHGVSWPTSSVLLHFGSQDDYPFLDLRALWSLGWKLKPERVFNFAFWWNCVRQSRQLASRCGVSMRIVDRALWQFSKENQLALLSDRRTSL